MAQASVDIAMEKTSQEILEMCKIIRTMVTDVEKFDWKNFWANMATGELFSTKFYNYESSTNPAISLFAVAFLNVNPLSAKCLVIRSTGME